MDEKLICLGCKKEMKKANIETEEGDWYVGWLCGCRAENGNDRIKEGEK